VKLDVVNAVNSMNSVVVDVHLHEKEVYLYLFFIKKKLMYEIKDLIQQPWEIKD